MTENIDNIVEEPIELDKCADVKEDAEISNDENNICENYKI
jgi:hypothetical protein